tara:strand:- start:220 stop:405 length:186 start_codon:yes stop_codon:yes gene_type:complete
LVITPSTFYNKKSLLTSAQLTALRFAGDNEILTLVDKAIKDNTPSKEKKSIKNWKTAHHRV